MTYTVDTGAAVTLKIFYDNLPNEVKPELDSHEIQNKGYCDAQGGTIKCMIKLSFKCIWGS